MATEQKPWLQKTLLNKQRYVRRHGYSWELHLETLAENDPVWSKIPAMELALFGCSSIPRERLDLPVPPGSADWSTKKPVPVPKGGREHWAWWFDIDTLITNYSVSLASIVVAAKEVHRENHKGKKDAPDLEMILSRDCNGLNAGSLLLRRSPWVQRFLALLWSMRDELPKIDKDKRSEQDALAYLYKTKEDVRARAAFLPQTVLNGNPEDISCLEWFEGTGESGRPWKRGDFTWHIAGSWAHTDNIMKRNGIKEDSEQAKNFEGSEFLFAKYWPQVVEE
ncbi:galactosyl transferase GMA12/MNN10 family-domain-containing protein [Hyaloraphidium curvatum]|nr:galactosyl transferase GMA12/MNN10 family-domain-containing protein [Hyaloraphidium curvatum]